MGQVSVAAVKSQVVFDEGWFRTRQDVLLWLLNNRVTRRWFRRRLGITSREILTGIHPNRITWGNEIVAESCSEYRVHLSGSDLREYDRRHSESRCAGHHPAVRHTTEFYTEPVIARSMYEAFLPLWRGLHAWDSVFAERWLPALDAGFNTLTVYPDPGNPGTTSCNGGAYWAAGPNTWSVAHNTPYGSYTGPFSSLGAGLQCIVDGSPYGGFTQLYRISCLYDTSSLGGSATISDPCVHSLWAKSILYDSVFAWTFNTFSVTPASNTVVSIPDYTNYGTVPFSAPIDKAAVVVSNYNDFTLNASGKAAISKTGITQLALREASYDAPNIEPVPNTSAYLEAVFSTASIAGQRPRLVVTWTSGGGIGPWGFEQPIVLGHRPARPVASSFNVAAPLKTTSVDFDSSPPRKTLIRPSGPTCLDVLPSLLFAGTGFESSLPPRKITEPPTPTYLDVLPSLLFAGAGWEPLLPMTVRAYYLPPLPVESFPSLPAGAFIDGNVVLARSILPRQPDADQAIPGKASGTTNAESIPPSPPPVRYRSPAICDPLAASSIISPYVDMTSVSYRARSPIVVSTLEVIVTPQGWKYGWDPSLPAVTRRLSGLYVFQDTPLPAPLYDQPPVKLPINVYIGGGSPHRWEPTEDEVAAYLDELYAERKEEVTPDLIMGREAYERERAERRSKPAPTLRPTLYTVGEDVDPRWLSRAEMLVSDAKHHGSHVERADVWKLRHRLHLCEPETDRKMVGGALVKIMPSQELDRVAIAKLAKIHRYRLVAYTANAIFLFDTTTLGLHVPTWAWLGMGAAWGLALGRELWSPEPPPQLPRKKPRRKK